MCFRSSAGRRARVVRAARRIAAGVLVAATDVLGSACRDAESTVAALPVAHPPGYVIDSVIPIDEALRRFRAGLPVATELDSTAARSRDALVHAFAAAIAARDTARLRALTLSRAEFAYLYYPFTPYVRRPYELAPETLWFLGQQASDKGLRRVVERLGGPAFRIAAYACDDTAAVQGRNRLWQHCAVAYTAGTDTGQTRRRLFGTIVERDGRFKFLSYVNAY